ncbi:signal transduction histidine kinase [Actinoplanes tereljensis]|uniref:histidine kinase n=1 Tax=Paractinoplanes tereljensis TaxID=571912 RepID=A0A919NKB8_9ACTN|nr:ATP-binding protein [Actinoplanes tereljensis]GIF20334.1 two-component sensor histidine kinase [Actinoplanes tereljensis]
MTVRLRLTLLYGGLFLVSGAVLLAITYLLVAHGGANLLMSSRSTTPTGQTVTTYLVGGLPDSGRLPEAEQRVTEALQQMVARQKADFLHQLLVKSGLALAVMAVVAAVFGWLMAGRVLRPVQTMTTRIQRISARNVHERLAVAGPRDEFKNLADTVDGLLGRLSAALDSHRRFVANAAHELRTPLTLERALLEETVLDPDATAADFRAQFAELMVVSDQQARLLDALLTLATSERGLDRREPVDLAEVTGEVLRATAPRLTGLDVHKDLRPAPITGDPALVERLVANLIDNAASYNIPGGRIEVTTGDHGLAVTNTGPPVPPEMVDRLLSPFQRLERTGDDGHHGLGLSIVQSIAVAHSAELTVRAQKSGGLAIGVSFV